jgi:hypothetical protein
VVVVLEDIVVGGMEMEELVEVEMVVLLMQVTHILE